MADRPIAAIVDDLRRHKVTQLVHPGDLLAVLDDWQRQADEIDRLEDFNARLQASILDADEKTLGALAEADRFFAELGTAYAELGALRALVRVREWTQAARRILPSDLRAALDRALADPTKGATKEQR